MERGEANSPSLFCFLIKIAMRNTVKTKTLYPVTLGEAKTQLHVEEDFQLDDIYITQLIENATQEAEIYVDADIAYTSVTDIFYDFDGSLITIQESPFIAIVSIAYTDKDGTETTLSSDDYRIRKGQMKFSVELEDSLSLEDGFLRIIYTTGYATREAVPSLIKQAILQRVSDYYDVNRGSMVSGSFKDSGAFERALSGFKRRSF